MITIVSTTNREGSITYKVAMLYSKLLDQIHVKNQILDLRLLPKDFVLVILVILQLIILLIRLTSILIKQIDLLSYLLNTMEVILEYLKLLLIV